MISLGSVIQITTPSMNPRIVNPSVINIQQPLMKSRGYYQGGVGMFERISIPKKRCHSCAGAR